MIITFPPHTTNIFQCLGLSLFGVLKKRINYKLPLDSDDSTGMFMKRIFHNMKQTLLEDNVRSVFIQIGVREISAECFQPGFQFYSDHMFEHLEFLGPEALQKIAPDLRMFRADTQLKFINQTARDLGTVSTCGQLS
jgi:hypothetical protein